MKETNCQFFQTWPGAGSPRHEHALTAAPDSVGLGLAVLVARRAGRRERGRDCQERPGPWPARRPARRPSDLGEIHLRAPRRPRPAGAAPASLGPPGHRVLQVDDHGAPHICTMMAAPHICRGRRVQREWCGGSRDKVPYRDGQGPAPTRRASPLLPEPPSSCNISLSLPPPHLH